MFLIQPLQHVAILYTKKGVYEPLIPGCKEWASLCGRVQKMHGGDCQGRLDYFNVAGDGAQHKKNLRQSKGLFL